jgi:hypothetical protein
MVLRERKKGKNKKEMISKSELFTLPPPLQERMQNPSSKEKDSLEERNGGLEERMRAAS